MKKTRMMIVIDTPTRKRLLDCFKVSYPTLKSALEYKTHTPQAKKIRKAALEMGGRVFSSENGLNKKNSEWHTSGFKSLTEAKKE